MQAASSGEVAGGAAGLVGSYVASRLDLALLVVDRRLSVSWANQAARQRQGGIWSALLPPDEPPGDGDTRDLRSLRLQLQALVNGCLRAGAESEALVEGESGSWFAAAVPLERQCGLVLLRISALHQLAAGARERLRRLFGLSGAEAQIAVQLASGETLESIAQARGVSVGTVRVQMRSVFRKTGIHRQGELICAVSRLAAG